MWWWEIAAEGKACKIGTWPTNGKKTAERKFPLEKIPGWEIIFVVLI